MDYFSVRTPKNGRRKSASLLVTAFVCLFWADIDIGFARETPEPPAPVVSAYSFGKKAPAIGGLVAAIGLCYLTGHLRLSKKDECNPLCEKPEAPPARQPQGSDDKYRRLVEGFTKDYIVYSLGEDHVLTYVSPSAKGVLGYAPDEIVGRDWRDFADMQSPVNQEADIRGRQIFAGELNEYVTERVLRNADGEARHFEVHEWPVRDDAGRIIAAEGIAKDITEHKASEAQIRQLNAQLAKQVNEQSTELQESEEVYRNLVENAPYGIHQIDLEGKMVSVNPAGLRMIGATEESEAIGQPFMMVVGQEDQHEIADLMERAFRGEASEFEFRSFDGHAFQSTFVPMTDAEGKIDQLMGITIDMTQRRQAEESLRESEQRMQDILDNTTAVVFVKDLEGRYLSINRQYERLFHLTKEQTVGKMDFEIFPRRTSAVFRENDLQVMEAEQAIKFEEVVPQDDGIHNYVSVKFPLFGADGSMYGVCGIATDITEQVKLNEEKLLLQDQLHQAQRMETVGHLASGIAHDFNNLLFVISAHVQSVKRRWPGASEIAESIKPIEEAVKQATSVSRSLIDFSKAHQPEKEFIDMGDAIRQTASMLRRLIPSSVDLTVDIPDQTIRIHADRTQLQQIVLNLVLNACDAMPDGGELTVRVVREKTNAGDANALLKVNDLGAGIPVENQARIFEPFFTTKAPDKGTGLGLSMVKRIVEEHSGAIEIHSQVGQGSAFTVAFPCVDREPVANEPDRPAQSEYDREGRGQVVLLAEADAQVRGILAGELESLGYVVVQAIDGRELIERYHENRDRIELLFVDVDLPHQNGLECVQTLRKEGVELPAVIMTGSEKVQLAHLDMEVGPSILIQKPFELDDIGVEVQSLLRRSAETVS